MVLYRDAFLADYHGNATSETDSRRYRGAPRRHHQTRKLHQGASRYVHGHGDVGGESGKIDRVPFFLFFFFLIHRAPSFSPLDFASFIYLFIFFVLFLRSLILSFYIFTIDFLNHIVFTLFIFVEYFVTIVNCKKKKWMEKRKKRTNFERGVARTSVTTFLFACVTSSSFSNPYGIRVHGLWGK